MADLSLKYGDQQAVHLHLSDDIVLADLAGPAATPLDDPVAAAAAALADPIHFPPLTQATVPGDRIVLALDHGVPRAAAVVAGVVQSLLEGYAEPANIKLVRASGGRSSPLSDPLGLLPSSVREAIEVLLHDPRDTKTMSYLAASRDAHPIYMNRTIFDADVVIPIGTLRLQESLNYLGVHGGLFPAFSDQETLERFRAIDAEDWQAHQQRCRKESAEAAWLLGTQLTVQVVPGPGESLLHILAGDPEAVAKHGRRLCEAAWRHEVPRRANLVIAAIEGGQEQQTWHNLARALHAASRIVSEEGTIVLCTQLAVPPGPALRRLATADEDRALERTLQRQRSADALPAWMLLEARRNSRVLLLSQLDGETVEDLGLGFVEQAEDIDRLGRQHDSCILLANAQHACPVPREEQEQWLALH